MSEHQKMVDLNGIMREYRLKKSETKIDQKWDGSVVVYNTKTWGPVYPPDDLANSQYDMNESDGETIDTNETRSQNSDDTDLSGFIVDDRKIIYESDNENNSNRGIKKNNKSLIKYKK